MLELQPLHPNQYRQVAEWEFGPQCADTDWARYEAEMNAPQWSHFGLYLDTEFVGAISLEQVSYNMAAYHVVTARRRIHPQALAQVLLDTASYLFAQGFTALVARIPREKRAAARLALRCDMNEYGHTPAMRFFMLTKSRYFKHGFKQAESVTETAVCPTATAAKHLRADVHLR